MRPPLTLTSDGDVSWEGYCEVLVEQPSTEWEGLAPGLRFVRE